jgi:hypothetical protein
MIGMDGWMDGYQKVKMEIAVNANKKQGSVIYGDWLNAAGRGSSNFGQNDVPRDTLIRTFLRNGKSKIRRRSVQRTNHEYSTGTRTIHYLA